MKIFKIKYKICNNQFNYSKSNNKQAFNKLIVILQLNNKNQKNNLNNSNKINKKQHNNLFKFHNNKNKMILLKNYKKKYNN